MPNCNCHEPEVSNIATRRDFLKSAVGVSAGLSGLPAIASAFSTEEAEDFSKIRAVQSGKAQQFTILHTADIHGQLKTHDEFFLEDNRAVFKKRGGFAVLKTMLNTLRRQNPANTILLDGGDCFQGSAVASLTEGRALMPLINNIGYDLILPGNWEVAYGKENMQRDLGGYDAVKICANMYHATADVKNGSLMFLPYWIKKFGDIKIGFIGYNDPMVPRRQSPAFSAGIKFSRPEENVAQYIHHLKQYEGCAMVFLVTHLGLAQQLDLANQSYIEGASFVLGADTHERIRQPIQGKYAQVTEPGAFGSFVSKLDVVVENGVLKDAQYQLLDVDSARYRPDAEMTRLVEAAYAPHKDKLKTVIGISKVPLMRYYVLETPMDNMITDAMMWRFQPDIAVSNGFRFCPPLALNPRTGVAEITEDYLYSMLPVDGEMKEGFITGQQVLDWLEAELHNVFAEDPTKRFGGWLIRFQGMKINFTIKKPKGQRLNWVKIGGQDLDKTKLYRVVTCEREGDPDDTLCRIEKVQRPKRLGDTSHNTIRAYLAAHSPISPQLEGRATATDAPQTLVTQLDGYDYSFR